MASVFPLQKVSTRQLQHLGETLWSWQVCNYCLEYKACNSEECPWQRSAILKRFFDYYKDLTARYEPDEHQSAVLRRHEDLFAIIQTLKSNPEMTKMQIFEKMFKDRPIHSGQERALNLAVRVIMMVNSSALRQSAALVEHGMQYTPWWNDMSFVQFINEAFPMTDHPSIVEMKQSLRATKLKKQARLSFQPTDDLRNHLRLDRTAAVVEIFHHTAFLKEQLRLTKDLPLNLSVGEYVRLGVLPRALALETLATLQSILFPLTEAKSKALLLSLISKSSFDPDILRYDSSQIRSGRDPTPENMPYPYFGARLADLYDELTNPTPRGLEKWFERKSGARYVMMATLIGVIIAIFLGLASLAIGGYQAWIGYQQWQHPIRNNQ